MSSYWTPVSYNQQNQDILQIYSIIFKIIVPNKFIKKDNFYNGLQSSSKDSPFVNKCQKLNKLETFFKVYCFNWESFFY